MGYKKKCCDSKKVLVGVGIGLAASIAVGCLVAYSVKKKRMLDELDYFDEYGDDDCDCGCGCGCDDDGIVLEKVHGDEEEDCCCSGKEHQCKNDKEANPDEE